MNEQTNYRKRLEEILLSISFGIAEPNEYKYILSIKISGDYTGKILKYLTNNYVKIVNQLTNKINDVKQREDLINKLNDFIVVHSKNCFFFYVIIFLQIKPDGVSKLYHKLLEQLWFQKLFTN